MAVSAITSHLARLGANNHQAVDGSKATKYIGYAALLGGLMLLAQSYLVRRGQGDAAAEAAMAPADSTAPEAAMSETSPARSVITGAGPIRTGDHRAT